MSDVVETRFCCPGEAYFIDRAVHRARLADGYPACRTCSHRFDGLQTAASKLPPATDLAAGLGPEGPLGVALNQIDVATSRQYGAAVGQYLREDSNRRAAPRVAIGGDGRWLTAPLVAAVSEGLQHSGCRAIETGGVTAGGIAFLMSQHGLDGGILVGNASGAPHGVSLRSWGADAIPLSKPGGLEHVEQALLGGSQRSSRKSGGLERLDAAREYRDRFAELFHGLRPLRWVMDSAAAPLVEPLRQLLAHSACQLLEPCLPDVGSVRRRPGRTQQAAALVAAALQSGARVAAGEETAAERVLAHRRRRVQRLCEQVVADRADFGLWVDGDGDTLELIDERGRPVAAERLLWALAERRLQSPSPPTVVLERSTMPAVKQRFVASGARVIESEPTRQAIDTAMRFSGAEVAGGPSGRLWFSDSRPVADVLLTLGYLLQRLSQADQPLSSVLA